MFETSSSDGLRMRRFLLAEIGLPHLSVGPDRLRRAARDDPAIDQDGDPVGQREHRFHVVLDQQDGQLALELAQSFDPRPALLPPHPAGSPPRASAARAGVRSSRSLRASRQKRKECPAWACTARATLSRAVKSTKKEGTWNEGERQGSVWRK